MFALAAIPAAAFGVGLMFIPDSPRWLVGKGRTDEARTVLKRLRAPENVESELIKIKHGAAQQKAHWSELFNPNLRAPMIVGIGLAVAQQVTGINTVIYYAPTIFKAAGMSSASVAILASVGVGIVNVVLTLVAMQLVDRVGRRPLLLVSLAGMAGSLAVLGLAFSLPQLAGSLGWIAVVSLMVYVGSFAVGLGPVFWLILSEIYPLRIRGRAMSIGTAANWITNLIVALTFLTLTQVLGKPATFWLYAVVSVGAWLFAFFLVPETKGKSLEQVEAQWRPATAGASKAAAALEGSIRAP
jgi:sugar porter (SP) family MFS transporter